MSAQPYDAHQATHPPSPSESWHELQQIPHENLSSPESSNSIPLLNPPETTSPPHEGVCNEAEENQGAEQDSLLSTHRDVSYTASSHDTILPTINPAQTPQTSLDQPKWKGVWHLVEKHWHNTWTPELLCCGLATFSLVAIGLILKEYNEQPLP